MFLGKPFSTMVTYVFFSTFVIVRNMRLQMNKLSKILPAMVALEISDSIMGTGNVLFQVTQNSKGLVALVTLVLFNSFMYALNVAEKKLKKEARKVPTIV